MKYLFSLLIPFLLMSCVTGRIKNTKTKAGEAVVFGRLTIEGRKEINPKNTRINLFSNTKPALAVVDEYGYFYTKVPLGELILASVDYVDGLDLYSTYRLESPSTQITDSQEVYYIGDIYLHWTPTDRYQTNKLEVRPSSQIMSEKLPYIPIDVEADNITIEDFKLWFPDNKKKIVVRILK